MERYRGLRWVTDRISILKLVKVVLRLPGALVLYTHHHQMLDWICPDQDCQRQEVDRVHDIRLHGILFGRNGGYWHVPLLPMHAYTVSPSDV